MCPFAGLHNHPGVPTGSFGFGRSTATHHPKYDFNDDILTLGAECWTRLVERYVQV